MTNHILSKSSSGSQVYRRYDLKTPTMTSEKYFTEVDTSDFYNAVQNPFQFFA